MKNVQIDIEKTKPIKCQNKIMGFNPCGCEEFKQVFFLRTVSAFLSPTMREELIPIPAFKCIKCGTIAELNQKAPEKIQ